MPWGSPVGVDRHRQAELTTCSGKLTDGAQQGIEEYLRLEWISGVNVPTGSPEL